MGQRALLVVDFNKFENNLGGYWLGCVALTLFLIKTVANASVDLIVG